MTAVLIYTRLSTEDVHDATVRQEVACRSYAEARNWEVAATLSDLDASAYQPRARRPGFETLISRGSGQERRRRTRLEAGSAGPSPQGLRTAVGGGGAPGRLHRVGDRAR